MALAPYLDGDLRRDSRRAWWLLSLVLLLGWIGACRSAPPTGVMASDARWVGAAPSFAAEAAGGRRVHITLDDPTRSAEAPRLLATLQQGASDKGYTIVQDSAQAEVLCRVSLRYLGRVTPPDGQLALVEKAGPTIQAGDENWLAADGSGFDTEMRKATLVRYKPNVRSAFGEVLRGVEEDAWALVLDFGIGVRDPASREHIQRHEGRLWSAARAPKLARPEAVQALLDALAPLAPAALPQ